MIYDYIIQNYKNGEPIFLSELPGDSKDYLRQEMKRLCDDGRLERLYNGVYYLPYMTILGTKGKVSMDRYIEKKYLNAGGYVTGLQLANKYGFTTQNPSCYEVCSNEATTKQRKRVVNGNTIIVYKPVTDITEENKSALPPVIQPLPGKAGAQGVAGRAPQGLGVGAAAELGRKA